MRPKYEPVRHQKNVSRRKSRTPADIPDGRTPGTEASSLEVRRMDSFARLLHTKGSSSERTIVTAVGFRDLAQNPSSSNRHEPQNYPGLVIAHNTTSEQIQKRVRERFDMIRKVMGRRRDAGEIAEKLKGDSPFKVKRLATDLRKLRKTLGVGEPKELAKKLTYVMKSSAPEIVDLSHDRARFGTVHAECALFFPKDELPPPRGPIGITKLSCYYCYELAKNENRERDVRGTHGIKYPHWKHPSTGDVMRPDVSDPANVNNVERPHLLNPLTSESSSDPD